MNSATKKLELLSKLLSEKDSPKLLYNQLYEKIFYTVKEKVSDKLNQSSYPQKAAMISELEEVLDSVQILTQFPELIGKTIIGIMGSKENVNDELLDRLSTEQRPKIYKYNQNIPTIIHNNSIESINAVNLIGSPVTITRDDFIMANQELYKDKIDIRQFLSAYSISAQMPYENISYVYFPFYSLKSQTYYNNLMDIVDIVIIPVDQQGKWKDVLDYLIKFRQNEAIYIAAKQENKAEIEKNIKEYPVHVRISNHFDHWIEPLDHPRNNVGLTERFLGITNRFNRYQVQRMESLTHTITGMNKDLVNMDDEETGDSVRELKVKLEGSRDKAKRIYSDFNTVTEELMELVDDFEKGLYSAASTPNKVLMDDRVLYHGDFEEECAQLVMDLIKTANFGLARDYIRKLKLRDYPYTYILELYIDDKMKKPLSQVEINQLKNDDSKHDIVLKAKVKFGTLMGLSSLDIANCATLINGPLDAYESYILGDYYSKTNSSKAKHYYKQSLEAGYLEAGNKLMEYQESQSYPELARLANMLVPEANYLYGIKCLESNKYAQGITYLKIAAVFEHLQAISKLADLEYSKAHGKYQNPDKRTEKSINIAFQLYQFLLSKEPDNEEIMERLGMMYYWREDYRRSRELLAKCNSAYAQYTCGRMYQYGNGVAQDNYKARDLFKASSSQGNTRAKVEYEKVCGWIESNRVKNAYREEKDYSTTTSYSSEPSRSGWCFLTTATCLALGKEDNCQEIIAMKKYRDEHLIFDKDGANLIRQYYKIAPSIVQIIKEQPSSNTIFKELYREYIRVCYEYLKSNDYKNAKATYIGMVENLCSQYEIEVI